jgi:hypothetical protein
MLRHRETWPPGFRWNYVIPSGCAFGLADRLWGWRASLTITDVPNDSPIFYKCRPPFVWWKPLALRRIWDVKPEHVADAIDAYLWSAQMRV